MSFDVVRTPLLDVVATDDEEQRGLDLQRRIEEGIGESETQAEVATAREASAEAHARLENLKIAQRTLNDAGKDLQLKMRAGSEAVLMALIDAAARGAAEFGDLRKLSIIETQERLLSRALQRLVEHLIPLAEIASLREESHCLEARAKSLEQIAQSRAERILGQLREAVAEEIVLPVDLSQGVAGALLARAREFKQQAVQLSETADRLERVYEDRRRAAA